MVVRESMLLPSGGGESRGGRPEEFLVINPITGYVFSAADANCSLLEIYSLVTPENIFANIQKDDRPCKMSFDVSNPVSIFTTLATYLTLPPFSLPPSFLPP